MNMVRLVSPELGECMATPSESEAKKGAAKKKAGARRKAPAKTAAPEQELPPPDPVAVAQNPEFISRVAEAVGQTSIVREVEREIYADECLTDLFIHRVAVEVDARVQQRQKTRDRVYAVLAAVATTIGTFAVLYLIGQSVTSQVREIINAPVTGLRDQLQSMETGLENRIDASIGDINSQLEDSIEASTESREEIEEAVGRVEKIEKGLENERYYFAFVNLARSLEQVDGFSREQTERAMELLNQIRESEEVSDRPDFLSYLEKIIDAFAAADLKGPIDEIVESFGDDLHESQGIVFTLVSHYGQRLVGYSLPPNRWPTELVERFEEFERAVAELNLMEFGLPWRLAIEFLRSNEEFSSTLDELFENTNDFDPAEKAVFITIMTMYSEPSKWMKEATREGIRIGEVFSSLNESFSNQLDEMRSDPDVNRLLEREEFLEVVGRNARADLAPEELVDPLPAFDPSEEDGGTPEFVDFAGMDPGRLSLMLEAISIGALIESGEPPQWPEEQLAMLRAIEEELTRTEYPELAHPWRLLRAFLSADRSRSDAGVELLNEAEAWSAQDRGLFVVGMIRYTTESYWEMDLDDVAQAGREVFEHLVQAYEQELRGFAGGAGVSHVIGEAVEELEGVPGEAELREKLRGILGMSEQPVDAGEPI